MREHRPDIVFLDIRMPGLTGVEAARQIAQLELDDDALLPEIVFITAYDQYASRRSSRAWPTTCSSPPSASAWR